MEEGYELLALYICLMVVQLLALCSFRVSRMFLGLTIHFVISAISVFLALLNRLTYGCPTNDLANSWLWIPHINFTIQPCPLTTGLPWSLKGHPHILVPVSLLTNSFFLHLYSALISQPINTNEILPLLPAFVSDLIITATNPFLWATDQAHRKTSSRLSNTYRPVHIISVSYNIFILLNHSQSWTLLPEKYWAHPNNQHVVHSHHILLHFNNPYPLLQTLYFHTSTDLRPS